MDLGVEVAFGAERDFAVALDGVARFAAGDLERAGEVAARDGVRDLGAMNKSASVGVACRDAASSHK